jgi:hypothetical protein
MNLFIKICVSKLVLKRAIKVALVVGTFFFVINHFHVIVERAVNSSHLLPIMMSYIVPFVVSVYSSACQAYYPSSMSDENSRNKEIDSV